MARSTKRFFSGEPEPPSEPASAERRGTILGIGKVEKAIAEAQARAKLEAAQIADDEVEPVEAVEVEGVDVEASTLAVPIVPIDQEAPTVAVGKDGRPAPTLKLGDEVLRCARCQTGFSGHERFCPFDGEPLTRVSHFDPSEDPLIGLTVSDRYIVEGVLAEGGMGKVYSVRHARLGNVFAMKVLRRDLAEDSDVAERLIEEARATAHIGHANIVSVSDFGEIDSRLLPGLGDLKLPYFVMEYVAGGSLSDVLRNDGMIAAKRLGAIMVQVAHALAAAHLHGIIHRDLKPGNIRLSSDESGHPIAKVLDFGVAKVIGSSSKTQQGVVFGTPHYMSPEQGQGLPVDHRTDVYALGVIMYECLTGEVPFAADTYMGVLSKHMQAAPAPMDASLFADAPLEAIVLKCMEKNPDDRYASMSALAADLEAMFGTGKSGATWRPPMPVVGAERIAPSKSRLGLFVFIGLMVVAALSAWALLRTRAETPAAAQPSPRKASETAPVQSHEEAIEPPVAMSTPAVSAASAAPPVSTKARVPRAGKAQPSSRPAPGPRPRRGSGEIVDPWAR